MPKRTDEFQTLITLIKHQLALEGVKVTESVELLDRRTGKKREVDIVLESCLAGDKVVVGIECTRQARPATIEWVERMAGKHEYLSTDKLILISKSGFRPDAVEDARIRGIDTYSLEKATAAHWKNTMNLKDVAFLHRRLYPSDFKFVCEETNPDSLQIKLSEIILHFDDGERVIPLTYPIQKILTDPYTHEKVNAKGQIPIELIFREGTYFLKPDKSRVIIHSVKFIVSYQEDESTIELQYGSLAGAQVAYGSADNLFGKVVVSIVEDPDGTGKLSVTVLPKKNKKSKK